MFVSYRLVERYAGACTSIALMQPCPQVPSIFQSNACKQWPRDETTNFRDADFCIKSGRATRVNFLVLDFVTATQSKGAALCK